MVTFSTTDLIPIDMNIYRNAVSMLVRMECDFCSVEISSLRAYRRVFDTHIMPLQPNLQLISKERTRVEDGDTLLISNGGFFMVN